VARKIFKAQEVTELKSKVLITPPQVRSKPQEIDVEPEVEEVEEAEPLEAAEEVQPMLVAEEERDRILG